MLVAPHHCSLTITATTLLHWIITLAEPLQQCQTTSSEVLTTRAITSGITRLLVLAGHLLYASPLASRLRGLRAKLCDMSRMNMVLWPGTCPARPGLHHATGYNIYTLYFLTVFP